ncbi:MAG: substrate-binding domain-containing protein [Myxococcales bacterium]
MGCAQAATSAVGTDALLAWRLAGAGGPNLPCGQALTVAGETELVGLLESRAADYVLLHRSTAERHHLKVTELDPRINLSRLELADAYQQAAVAERRGQPIACALAIPDAAVNPDGARLLAAALVSEHGRKALLRSGYRPVDPPISTVRSLAQKRPTP